MGMFDALDISGTGLTAQRLRMDVTAENLANAQSTNYRRKDVVLQQAQAAGASFGQTLDAATTRGVQVAGVVEDSAPGKRLYDPGNPAADAQGYVTMPNVDSVTEMVDLISSSRSYEANVTAMQASKQMFTKTLDLLR
jgi:flagellar basal-body rod protein FlgC